MTESRDPLHRIADALERLVPTRTAEVDWCAHPAYVWAREGARAIDRIEAPELDQLRAIDRQKKLVLANLSHLAQGFASHDMLLWGARGMGKSALLRSATVRIQNDHRDTLGLVQIAPDALDGLPRLFSALGTVDRQFLIFIDDLGFAEDDTIGPRNLRSWLDGGVEARPPNCRLAVTSNRRAILARKMTEQDPDSADSPLNMRDAVDDKLALADRFGLTIGFHPIDAGEFLEIVHAYADPLGLVFDEDEAMAWAIDRGQRSGRIARQYVVELAGKAGQAF